MNRMAIVLVTDAGFLVPSLVVCSQLLAQGADREADVLLYLVDVAPELRLRLEEAFPRIRFEELVSRAFVPPEGTYFKPGHVPPVSLARLVLHEALPERYEHLLYLDGDVQIVGDIGPLLRYRAPEGRIAAARGSLWLEAESDWRNRYLQGLGGVSPDEYFNAGVMAFRRDSWAEIAPKALRFFLKHPEACERHDQSALNAICKGRVEELPPAYNFHIPYAELYVQRRYTPRIIHFTGPNKPWKCNCLPWKGRFFDSYRAILDAHPFLHALLDYPPSKTHGRGYLWKIFRARRKAARKRKAFFAHVAEKRFAVMH